MASLALFILVICPRLKLLVRAFMSYLTEIWVKLMHLKMASTMRVHSCPVDTFSSYENELEYEFEVHCNSFSNGDML